MEDLLEQALAYRLVDVRDAAAFATRRVRGSVSMPAAELVDMLFELPDPSLPIALLGPPDALRSARELVEGRGWKVPVAVEEEEQLWAIAKANDLLGACRAVHRAATAAPHTHPFRTPPDSNPHATHD
jgi:rhodanese-related sulfurtransferase